jgi:CRP/FNR family transcriptional regulator, cyclic AMP receptor protein
LYSINRTETDDVAKAKKQPFNLGDFLNCLDGGGTQETYRKNQKVYTQGDPAVSVFYVQEGKLKVCVLSEQEKEAVGALHGDYRYSAWRLSRR